MKVWKRSLAIVMSGVMLLGMAACGEKDQSKNKLPDKDPELASELEGYTFTIMSPWMAGSSEEAVTEAEKSFWKRAEEVEKEYGCVIRVVDGELPTVDHIRAQIMSGSKVADVVHVMAEETLSLAAGGYITPWSHVEGLDVTDSRWVEGYTKLGTVNNDVYGLNWLRAPEARMCIVVNKTLLKNSGITEDIYELAENRQWTWDAMRTMAQGVVKKYTTNGQTTVWGVGGWYQEIARALWNSNGASLVSYEAGTPATGYNSDRMIEAIDFMNQLVNTDKVINAANYREPEMFNSSDNGDGRSAFLDGKLAFLFEETWFVNQYLKPSNPDFEYGIVPVPMGPGATEYRTDAGTAGVFVCTSTNAESQTIDKTVAILNLLSEPEEGYEDDSWWEYDLKKEYFQDESAEKDLAMYKICLDTAVCDYGVTVTTLYKKFDRNVVQDTVFFNNGTAASNIQALGSSYDKAIDSMFRFSN